MKVYYPFLGILLISLGITKADLISVGEEEINLEGVTIGIPTLGGSGCPQGSVSAFLSSEKKDLIIAFNDYFVEAYGSSRTARKNCALAIPIHLPSGVSVSLISQKIEGFNYIPEGASTVLTTEAFFNGQKGDILSTRFDGAIDDTFAVESAVPVTALGQDVILRVNTGLRVKTNRFGDYALSGVVSLGEKENSLTYSLKFAKCSP